MTTQYRTTLMDPPWPEFGGGKCKRGADRHYALIKTKEEILRVILQSGVFNPDPECSHLWCWATMNHLPKALWLIEALGFRYVTNVVWVKGEIADQARLLTQQDVFVLQNGGLGQYVQSLHEHLLLGVQGETCKPDPRDRIPSVIVAPRGKHSEKPPVFRQLIQRNSPGPYLEMFARDTVPGWDSWGAEVNRR